MKRDEIKDITGVILAGGQGQRMGGKDKGLVNYRGVPLYQHVATCLKPQVGILKISANRNLTRYADSGMPVITDSLPDFQGPLAGMLSALQQADTSWCLFAACDTPLLPSDLVERLWQAKEERQIVWARSAGRDHPVIALVHSSLAAPLKAYLESGERRVLAFFQKHSGHAIDFIEDEAFANFNTLQDLER
ncbi:molybdenum cofactor guanylyltransferase MobA [Enterobacterales bacterium CwR94]|nr:molybdenum cofactor guanylyltransferase MobA [Enterobacterales bacterium CwR94]